MAPNLLSRGDGDQSRNIVIGLGAALGVIVIGILIVLYLLRQSARRHKQLLAQLSNKGVAINENLSRFVAGSTVAQPRFVLRRKQFLPGSGWGGLSSCEELDASDADGRDSTTTTLHEKQRQSNYGQGRARFLSQTPAFASSLKMKRVRDIQLMPLVEKSSQSSRPNATQSQLSIMSTQEETLPTSASSFNATTDIPLPPPLSIRTPDSTTAATPASTDLPENPDAGHGDAEEAKLIASDHEIKNRSDDSPPISPKSCKPLKFNSDLSLEPAQRPITHSRSISICSAHSGLAPEGPVPPLPLAMSQVKLPQRSRSAIDRSPSRHSVSSFESGGSSILATMPSPAVHWGPAPTLKDGANHDWQRALVASPRPIRDTLDLHGRTSEKRFSGGSVTKPAARYRRDSTKNRKIASKSERTASNADKIDTKISSSLHPEGAFRASNLFTHLGRSMVTPNGSPSLNNRVSILRDVSGNQATPPARQLSQTSTQASSTRSSNGNPFQWDPSPLQSGSKPPSALKGSPTARKKHRRQNCVRIALDPQILGPSSRNSCSSMMKEIKEESPKDITTGVQQGTSRSQPHTTFDSSTGCSLPRPPSASSFSPAFPMRPTTLRASLSPQSRKLALTDYNHDSLSDMAQVNVSFSPSVSPLRLQSKHSKEGSIISVPSFPSPGKDPIVLSPAANDHFTLPGRLLEPIGKESADNPLDDKLNIKQSPTKADLSNATRGSGASRSPPNDAIKSPVPTFRGYSQPCSPRTILSPMSRSPAKHSSMIPQSLSRRTSTSPLRSHSVSIRPPNPSTILPPVLSPVKSGRAFFASPTRSRSPEARHSRLSIFGEDHDDENEEGGSFGHACPVNIVRSQSTATSPSKNIFAATTEPVPATKSPQGPRPQPAPDMRRVIMSLRRMNSETCEGSSNRAQRRYLDLGLRQPGPTHGLGLDRLDSWTSFVVEGQVDEEYEMDLETGDGLQTIAGAEEAREDEDDSFEWEEDADAENDEDAEDNDNGGAESQMDITDLSLSPHDGENESDLDHELVVVEKADSVSDEEEFDHATRLQNNIFHIASLRQQNQRRISGHKKEETSPRKSTITFAPTTSAPLEDTRRSIYVSTSQPRRSSSKSPERRSPDRASISANKIERLNTAIDINRNSSSLTRQTRDFWRDSHSSPTRPLSSSRPLSSHGSTEPEPLKWNPQHVTLASLPPPSSASSSEHLPSSTYIPGLLHFDTPSDNRALCPDTPTPAPRSRTRAQAKQRSQSQSVAGNPDPNSNLATSRAAAHANRFSAPKPFSALQMSSSAAASPFAKSGPLPMATQLELATSLSNLATASQMGVAVTIGGKDDPVLGASAAAPPSASARALIKTDNGDSKNSSGVRTGKSLVGDVMARAAKGASAVGGMVMGAASAVSTNANAAAAATPSSSVAGVETTMAVVGTGGAKGKVIDGGGTPASLYDGKGFLKDRVRGTPIA